MRAEINTTTYPSTATVNERASFNTTSRTNLSVTVTIESNHRRATTYRVVERPDGVIVEHPQYRPSPSNPKMTAIFQPQDIMLKVPKGRTIQEKIEEDLRGIRTFDDIRTKCERKRGRDGYNRHPRKCDSENKIRMQRWLDGEEPWTPFAITSSTSSRGRGGGS